MKLKTIKTEAEAIQAAYEYVDDQPPLAVTIRDGSIHEVRIGRMVISSTYGMNVSRMIEHEEGQRYRLIATAPGFPKQVTYHKLLSELRAKQRECFGPQFAPAPQRRPPLNRAACLLGHRLHQAHGGRGAAA